MCHITYYHFPACGHISYLIMLSCTDYLYSLRSTPGELLSCKEVEIYHELTTEEEEDICLWCWEALATASIDDPMTAFGSSIHHIEGLYADIPPFELAAQFNPEMEGSVSSDLSEFSVSDEDQVDSTQQS